MCAEFLLSGWLRPYLDALLANVEVANSAKMQMVLTNWQILFGLVAVYDAATLPPLPRVGASAWDGAARDVLALIMPEVWTCVGQMQFLPFDFSS